MAESVSTSIENNNPQKLKKEDIMDLLNKFEKSGNSDDFDIDGNSEISEKEIEIKKQLSQIQDKVGFLKGLLAKIEQKQNINKQNTGTESKETNPNLLNKELKDYTPEEAKEGLKYLQDHYQSYKRPGVVDGKINENAKISEIEDNHDAHLFQKELLKKIDPVLFKDGLTSTHIRGFDFIKGESIISIEDFEKKLNNPNTKIKGDKFDENVISYMEMSRYVKYIGIKEGKELDFSDNNDKKNLEILKKYLPKHILESFLVDWKGQIMSNNIFNGAWITSDEIKEGEYDIILDNLTQEEEAQVILCVKDGYTVEEIKQIIIDKNNTIKLKLEKYRIKHKEYYDAEEQKKAKEEEEKNNQLKNKTDTNSNNWTEIYTQTNNGYIIKAPNGKEIKISEKEKNNTFGRPYAFKNLINFYNFFEELDLLGAWDYREDLMLAIGDIYINPNDGDSIKKEELRKYGNELLTFISNIENKGKGKKFDLQNLNSVKRELRKFSGSNSMLSKSKTHNIQGEDKLTAYLRSEGIIGEAYFKTNEFRENLIA